LYGTFSRFRTGTLVEVVPKMVNQIGRDCTVVRGNVGREVEVLNPAAKFKAPVGFFVQRTPVGDTALDDVSLWVLRGMKKMDIL
jgi:hypothetical protein